MINITTDAYIWRVTYHDDTQIPEFDEVRPYGRGFAEVDSRQIKALELCPLLLSPVDQQMIPPHRVTVPSGATPVFFRRRSLEVNPVTNSVLGRRTTHCIGWHRDGVGCYLFVHEDGSSLLTDNLQAV